MCAKKLSSPSVNQPVKQSVPVGYRDKSEIDVFEVIMYLLRESSEKHLRSFNEILNYLVQMHRIISYAADLNYYPELNISEKLPIYQYDDDVIGKLENIYNDGKAYKKDDITPAHRLQLNRVIARYLNKNLIYNIKIRSTEDIPYNQKGDALILSQEDKDMKIFYAEHLFESGMNNALCINLLRDAVRAFKYVDVVMAEDIINSLDILTPKYNRNISNSMYNRAVHNFDIKSKLRYTSVYEVLEVISEAMSSKKMSAADFDSEQKNRIVISNEQSEYKEVSKIEMKYGAYSYNQETGRIELVAKHDRYKTLDGEFHDDETFVVNPVMLMLVNGYYYLIAYYPDRPERFKNYRIDRIISDGSVRVLDEKAELPSKDEFDPDDYAYKYPVMYYGETCEKIVIRCKSSVINNVVDTFGIDVKISPLKDGDFDAEIELNDINPSGLKMWALEYYWGAEIIEPESLREEMRKAGEKMAEMYK